LAKKQSDIKRAVLAAASSLPMRAVADQLRAAAIEPKQAKPKFPKWAFGFAPSAAPPPDVEKSIADPEIESLVRDIVREHGGYIAQDKGAKIVRDKFPEAVRQNDRRFHKKHLMDLFATENGGDRTKRGPKGPRKTAK
jgi:hypothetical protein